MSHGHFILKCQCGEVIAQCRCISPGKTVEVSKAPCEKCKLAGK